MGRGTDGKIGGMSYDAKKAARFMIARENLALALHGFEQNPCLMTDRELMDKIAVYERHVPKEVIIEACERSGRDLVYDARLRLEQYHNACFANK